MAISSNTSGHTPTTLSQIMNSSAEVMGRLELTATEIGQAADRMAQSATQTATDVKNDAEKVVSDTDSMMKACMAFTISGTVLSSIAAGSGLAGRGEGTLDISKEVALDTVVPMSNAATGAIKAHYGLATAQEQADLQLYTGLTDKQNNDVSTEGEEAKKLVDDVSGVTRTMRSSMQQEGRASVYK